MPVTTTRTASGRQTKRVIYSETSSEAEEEEQVDELESEEEVDEEDAEGEEDVEMEEGSDAGKPGPSGVSSAMASDDLDVDAEGEEEDEEEEVEEQELPPRRAAASSSRVASGSGNAAQRNSSPVKIKLNIKGKTAAPPPPAKKGPGRPSRAAAKKASKRAKLVAKDLDLASDDDQMDLDDDDMNDVDEFDSTPAGSISPSKMTARQRAKGNKDLQDTLLELPENTGKKLELTEAEKLQRREEIARRRKRQTEQKLQDEQDQTINRLLRAQTGRSRAKLDVPSPALDDTAGSSRFASPFRRTSAQPKENMIRWVSSLNGDDVVLRVAAPTGKESWIDLGITQVKAEEGVVTPRKPSSKKAVCGVKGCGQVRKYRSVKEFEKGGCSMEHLKMVEASL